ncbi:MAG: MarR family transcriptional regulator [Alphaproteobacteria bacterium]|nr:MarR family transcriptional regulator [Alphaproteobacteria bacterium]
MSNKKHSTKNDLAQTLAVEIRAIHRALKVRVRENGGTKNLTASQMFVLAHLEKDGPATVSSLARAEGMRPQSMSELIAPLQEAGFISGKPDPKDGRQTLMSLTPKCVEWIKTGKAESHDWLTKTISQRLTPQEQVELNTALKLLRRVTE